MVRWMLLFCLVSAVVRAEVVLPRVFGHHMVLQRGKPLTVWGNAAVGEEVTVRFSERSARTYAGMDGRWQVVLPAFPASAVPADLVIQGTNTIVLQDILVGEVWLCSGQSNMEYTLRKNSKVSPELGEKYRIDGRSPVEVLDAPRPAAIRWFLVNRKTLPQPDSAHAGWLPATDPSVRTFSAPAYFFAEELQRKLGVPVGVIASAVPGSRIEPWIDATVYRETFSVEEGDPGKFFTPMIRPLAPLSLAGILWYQGESNCFLGETDSYTRKLKTLISNWRTVWNDAALPFYFVQLAPYRYSAASGKVLLTRESLPAFWEAQEAVLTEPYIGMVTITDLIVDPGDLHPPFKWEIGRRLARLALSDTYQRKDETDSGPVLRQAETRGQNLVLSFGKTGAGLASRDGKYLTGFELAGNDGVFVPVEADIISPTEIRVHTRTVKHPVSVRFGWDEVGQANLVNRAGRPARPFRKQLTEPSARRKK
jgi:sialate O-acetylesterase